MMAGESLSSVAIDLTRLKSRTISAFYSNLVTRPTGRAVRMGVEQQLVELGAVDSPCLSVLDFSQVRIMDYSCADEVVAKLLLRYTSDDRPLEVYFLARGLQDHHLEAIDAVLERRGLLLASESEDGDVRLLGPCSPDDHRCWEILVRSGRVRANDVVSRSGLPEDRVASVLERFVTGRVLAPSGSEFVCPVSGLNSP